MGAFLLIGFLPFLLAGGISYYRSKAALRDKAFDQLQSVLALKKRAMENFFDELKTDITVLGEELANLQRAASEKMAAVQAGHVHRLQDFFTAAMNNAEILAANPAISYAVGQFSQCFSEKGLLNEGLYGFLEDVKYDFLSKYKMLYDYHDVMLINPEGRVVFTANRGADLGENVLTGTLRETSLAAAHANAMSGSIVIQDFAPYGPEEGEPICFVAMPLIGSHDNAIVGVLAFKIDRIPINRVMHQRDGMGKTGETYLVGRTGEKTVYRSDRAVKKGVFGDPKAGPDIERALAGESGIMVKMGSTGGVEISRYAPFRFSGLQWAVISTIEYEEVILPLEAEREAETDFFHRFVEAYGFHDLFLIHPDGQVFYTVTRESDYRSNVFRPPLAGTGLGRLAKRIVETRDFTFVDFAPYAPSGGAPSAFMGKPILFEGEIEIIAAVQIPPAHVNAVMSQRDGMGATGETYLVGTDLRMRSDAFHDPERYSVAASFKNAEAGKMETDAARAALAGQSGRRLLKSYGDRQVLSAFAPLGAWGVNYAMIAEIEAGEAFGPIRQLGTLIGAVAVPIALAILLMALFMSRRITSPVNRVIADLRAGADNVGDASEELLSVGQVLSEGASQQAASLQEVASSLEEIVSMVRANAEGANRAEGLKREERGVIRRAGEDMAMLARTHESIAESSREIESIVGTMEDIAFQTNLLALNAAVEAARAGEAGAGFAVVAGEVRNLARRAADGARQTGERIQKTVRRIQSGDGLVKSAEAAFKKVAESSDATEALIREVAAASDEQARGIEQINRAISEMDQVTQATAANAETAAASSETLRTEATRLKACVDDLARIIEGTRG